MRAYPWVVIALGFCCLALWVSPGLGLPFPELEEKEEESAAAAEPESGSSSETADFFDPACLKLKDIARTCAENHPDDPLAALVEYWEK